MRVAYVLLASTAWLLLQVWGVAGQGKTARSVRGRRGWRRRLRQADRDAKLNGRKGPWLHVHCASLGEYEQAAPVLRQLRTQRPDSPILLTFFSPSGKDHVQSTEADHVDYLPWDVAWQARRFAGLLDLSDTVLVKYELWPETIRALVRCGTRVHLIAARFDDGRHPLGWTGGHTRRTLRRLHSIQVQDARSAALCEGIGLTVTVTGDPRVDQVLNTLESAPPAAIEARMQRLREWKENRKLLLIGSAWPPEWDALKDVLKGFPDWVALWAPHDVRADDVKEWAEYEGTEFASHWTGHTPGPGPWKTFSYIPGNPDMLVDDEIGLLKYAYRMADLAVVGGGWGQGVHNVLEPAAFGVPVLCGPRVQGFREIEALHDIGAVQVCDDARMLHEACTQWMKDDSQRKSAGRAAARWVEEQGGAAERIVQSLLNGSD